MFYLAHQCLCSQSFCERCLFAVDAGNNIITVTNTAPWRTAVEPIYTTWVADMKGRGIDGQAMIDQARGLMDGECKGATGKM